MIRLRTLGILFVCATNCFQTGCRTTRPEVPPPPRFTTDGRKQPLSPIGFGSAPKQGFMTDASSQMAPGVPNPGQEKTSNVGSEEYRTAELPQSNSAILTASDTPSAGKSSSGNSRAASSGLSLGGIMRGLGTGSAPRDPAVQQAGGVSESPSSLPLEPPVMLPPPPLIPPPSAVAPPAMPNDDRIKSGYAPSPLPEESAVPPLIPETGP